MVAKIFELCDLNRDGTSTPVCFCWNRIKSEQNCPDKIIFVNEEKTVCKKREPATFIKKGFSS